MGIMVKKGVEHSHGADCQDLRESSDSALQEETETSKSMCQHVAKSVSLADVKRQFKAGRKIGQCEKKVPTPCSVPGSKEKASSRAARLPDGVWMCLQCGHQGCANHATQHVDTPRSDCHALAVDTGNWVAWCFTCDDEVSLKSNKKLHETVQFVRKKQGTLRPIVTPPKEDRPANKSSQSVSSKDKLAQEKDRDVLPKVKGLINLGNTCYLNSVLQCVSQCHYLTHYLDIANRSGRRVSVTDEAGQSLQLVLPEGGPLTASLCHFLKQMHTVGTAASVSPGSLLSKIAQKAAQFVGFDQQDAHELLRALMEQVRLEDLRRHQREIMLVLGVSTKTDPKKVDNDVKSRLKTLGHQVSHTTVDSIFSGQLINLVVCQACMARTYRFEPFLDLSLPVAEDKPTRPRKLCGSGADDDGNEYILTPKTKGSATNKSKHSQKKERRAARRGRQDHCMTPKAAAAGEDVPSADSGHEMDRGSDVASCGEGQSDADVEDNGDTDLVIDSLLDDLAGDARTTPGSSPTEHITTGEESGSDGRSDGDGGRQSRQGDPGTAEPSRSPDPANLLCNGADSLSSALSAACDEMTRLTLASPHPAVADCPRPCSPMGGERQCDGCDAEVPPAESRDGRRTCLSGGQGCSAMAQDRQTSLVNGPAGADGTSCGRPGQLGCGDTWRRPAAAATDGDAETGQEGQHAPANSGDTACQYDRRTSPDTETANTDTHTITPDTETASLDTQPATPDTHTAIPDTQATTPDTQTATTDTQAATTYTQTATPDTQTVIPDTQATTTDTQTATPDTQTATPDTHSATIDTQTATPDTHTATPDTQTATPDTQTATPDTQTATTDTQTATTDTQTTTTDTHTAIPDTQTVTTDTQTTTPDTHTAIPDTQATTTDTQTATTDTHTATPDIQTATTDTQTATPDTQAATTYTQTATQDTQTATPDTQAPTQDTQTATQDTQAATTDTQTAAPDTQTATADTQTATTDTQTATPDTRTDCRPTASDAPTDGAHSSGAVPTQSEWLSRALTTLSARYQAAAGECSLLTCLNQYTAPELLTGNNKFGCESCTRQRDRLRSRGDNDKGFGGGGTVYSNASKQMLIYSPPPVLTIQLKRFEVCSFSLRKVNRHVQFDERFDLAPFCSSICQDLPQVLRGQRRVDYSLFGVVEHTGRLNSGHYTAYVRVRRRHDRLTVNPALLTHRIADAYQLACAHAQGGRSDHAPPPPADSEQPEPGRWFHVSDTHVTEVTVDKVLRAQAYMLFYERVA